MQLTPQDFKDVVGSDIWVLEQMLTLPSDPEVQVEKTDKEIRINIFNTFAMPQMQEAVKDYRSGLLPAIFVTAQKVYAELFRVILGNSGASANNRQVDIENAMKPLLAKSAIANWHPFNDAPHFSSWWTGNYNFRDLRLARNRVVHDAYTFGNGRLVVKDETGAVTLLNWSENDTLEFTQAVVNLSKKI